MIKHDFKNGKYYINDMEVTKEEYETKKEELVNIRQYSEKLFSGEILESDVPTDILDKVKSIVEIRKQPSMEEPTETGYAEAGKILLGVSE